MVRRLVATGLLTLYCLPLGVLAESIKLSPGSSMPNFIDTILLPEKFPIYLNGSVVVNHHENGFTEKFLPTNNDFKGRPGCYVACYSHDPSTGVYRVSKNIYVQGQVRVSGNYKGKICQPQGYLNKNISNELIFRQLCASKINACKYLSCWAGGDTGGWFGIK